MFPKRTLRVKLGLFLLLPVFFIILFAGGISFLFARSKMLEQWHESAKLKLEVAARLIETRLLKTSELVNLVLTASHSNTAGVNPQKMITLLKNMEGVRDVSYTGKKLKEAYFKENADHEGPGKKWRFRSEVTHISAPVFESDQKEKIITIHLDLLDASGIIVGRLRIKTAIAYLLSDITRLGWWQYDLACIINQDGAYIASTGMVEAQKTDISKKRRLLESRILSEMASKPFGIVSTDGHPPELIGGFYKMNHAPWTLVMFAQGRKILRPILFYRNIIVGGSLVVLLVIFILIHRNIGKILVQIRMLATASRKVEQGEYIDPIPVKGQDEIGELTQSFNAMVTGLKQRDSIRDFFGRYVDPDIAKYLIDHPEAGKLGGNRRRVVMMMSDIRGFTVLSEKHPPEIIIDVLNQYFPKMIDIIIRHGGIIVDFCGDAILTYFDPLTSSFDQTIGKSINCAMEMQGQMKEFNRKMTAENLPGLSMGIGIHAGDVVVGNIGSKTRTKFGIVGSAVNVTSRIQAVAQNNEIVISDSVYDCLSRGDIHQWRLSPASIVNLKGVEKPMRLHVIQPGTANDRYS